MRAFQSAYEGHTCPRALTPAEDTAASPLTWPTCMKQNLVVHQRHTIQIHPMG